MVELPLFGLDRVLENEAIAINPTLRFRARCNQYGGAECTVAVAAREVYH